MSRHQINRASGIALTLFLATADRERPLRGARPLAVSTVAVVIAFGVLHYLEHHG